MSPNPASTGFGLAPGELRLETVGPEWAERFAAERGRIAAALGSAARDIQHIGSTAIPGILAKPILDLAVAIESFEAGRALVAPLVGLGYTYLGENGIPRRHFFMRFGCHLHLFENDGPDWRRHLFFRDRLRACPELARRYSQVKQSVAVASGGSRERYQSLKSAFIEESQIPGRPV